MSLRLTLIAAAASLTLAASANAATYVGSRAIGTGSVNISITTDGTIGAIDDANITDYTFQLFNTDGTFTLTAANSGTLITGGLSATATQLLFDFGVSGLALFQAPTTGSARTFYCLQGFSADCFDVSDLPGEAVEATDDYIFPSTRQSGVQVIASVAGGAVPEPATWGMMLLGFGMVGHGLRRRRSTMATRVTFA